MHFGLRPACLTHRNVLASSRQMQSWLGLALDIDNFDIVTPLPLYQVFPLGTTLMALASGAHNRLVVNPRDAQGLCAELKRACGHGKVIDIVQFRNTNGEKVSGWLVLGVVVAVDSNTEPAARGTRPDGSDHRRARVAGLYERLPHSGTTPASRINLVIIG